MPELPDVTVYIEALQRHAVGHELTGLRIKSPFLVRSVSPAPDDAVGQVLRDVRRIGKRIVLGFATSKRAKPRLFHVIHLMIAGRLRWIGRPNATIPQGKNGLAAWDFGHGTLVFTEASTKKRASLHVVAGEDGLAAHDPGGIDPMTADDDVLTALFREHNHTLKRALTDPRLLSGIGNAYSDEILHAAKLSPLQWTSRLSDEEMARLRTAIRTTLQLWIDRTREEVGDGFPDKVTAFRPDMAVHGRYREPCPICGSAVQRIAYADNETNYCPTCQTEGRLLADRSLSRLMKKDWPKTLAELEAMLRPDGPAK